MKRLPRNRRLPILAALGWLLALLVPGIPASADDYGDALGVYQARIGRASLHKRTDARVRLARTGDPRALDLLATSYAKPEGPRNRVRHLIASICTHHFCHPRYLGRIQAWRGAHAEPRDAWLWLESLRLDLWGQGHEVALDLLGTTEDPWLRAAAIESLAAGRHPTPWHHARRHTAAPVTARWAAHLLDDLPRDPLARALQIEACSAVITSHPRDGKGPQVNEALAKLIDRLDDRKLADRTALTIVRHLGSYFDVEDAERDSQVWRRYLAADESLREAGGGGGWSGKGGGHTVAFAGLKATGTHIAYVIDASNSMCAPLGDKERARLRGAITPSEGVRGRKRPVIDWDKVQTRFDAVREFLKVSLLGLPKGYQFSVILFGSKASFLGGKTELQKVSKRSIRGAIEALDAIAAKPATDVFPHGVLLGETNMHGGLRRAFLVREDYGKAGLVLDGDGLAYVDPELLLQDGCDTIFVLSDGAPNQDDWTVMDQTDPGDKAVIDRESSKAVATPPEMLYTGPYGTWPRPFMMDDVRRMNLFRRVEVHCVGVGEADMKMLAELSKLGNGRFLELTPPK